jgi:hypothetical protein
MKLSEFFKRHGRRAGVTNTGSRIYRSAVSLKDYGETRQYRPVVALAKALLWVVMRTMRAGA